MKRIEGHNVEYKSAWRDEYLEWIIGIDDKGKPKKGENIKKLSEDLPNKIRDILGVLVDVFVRNVDGIDYLGLC